MTVWLPPELLKKLRRQAKQAGQTVSEFVAKKLETRLQGEIGESPIHVRAPSSRAYPRRLSTRAVSATASGTPAALVVAKYTSP